MSRWFRHYAGMMRDEKLVRVAIQSKQPVERVVWVWGAILESACEVDDGGRFDFDAGEAAYFLRVDESDIGDILSSLDAVGRISGGIVVKWGDRQFESDKSKDRQKRYRERLKSSRDGEVTSRDGDVTVQYTDTDTDTDTEDTSSLRSDVCPEQEKSAPASPPVIELPATQGQSVAITAIDVAEWADAFPAVDVQQKLRAIRQWLLANPQKRKTSRGMKRFVVSWLTREQDKGGSRPTGPPPRRESEFARQQRECTEALERKVYGDRYEQSSRADFDLEPGNWRAH